jgi:hypothetical protein
MNAPDHSHFESQARACERLGSPFTARLCRLLPKLLDEMTATGRRAPVSLSSTRSISPWTVGFPFWSCHPWKGEPSYWTVKR